MSDRGDERRRRLIITLAHLIRGAQEHNRRKWHATLALLERERLAIADELDAAAMTRVMSSECVG
jgi:hypothetical protein